jgi:uncharacterized protein (UPF0261 family)/ABC-type branched-subunit amino acid transport system ATPase component
MALFGRRPAGAGKGGAVLEVSGLDVYYGRAHALQGVDLAIEGGVTAIVGRNGMGKTTLCNAITGLTRATGSVRFEGAEILGLPPNEITRRGIGYVPQGRRTWASLTVDEHLRLVARGGSRWTVERIYRMFPRLAERKGNGGAQLSGGEQQMLAIGRALLLDPRLLVMDEPTEGLAPVIVEQVVEALKQLTARGEIAVLLVEQNLGVAIDVADRVAVMVNGRIARQLTAAELGADRELQERLLGVRSAGEDNGEPAADAAAATPPVQVLTIRRAYENGAPRVDDATPRAVRGFNRWNAADPAAPLRDLSRAAAARGETAADAAARATAAQAGEARRDAGRVFEFPVSASSERAAYVAGTFDTKGRELLYLKQCLDRLGIRTVTVDLSTSGATSTASVHPRDVARHHPQGERAVFSGDRGAAVTAMALAFERFLLARRDVGGVISAGGSGGTALATPAMRALPVGVPKVMVSSVASGDVRPYVGPADICMMYSVTDVSGINRISEKVLANAAHALAGMIAHRRQEHSQAKPAIGLTMFGVTTACVQATAKLLEAEFDCLVFHATGTGGQSMEKLADSGLLAGVLDITTTEVCDEIVGGVLSAGPQRMGAIARSRVPYVGSCGALDMVNFWAWDTVPAKFKDRSLYKHNPNVTLMRTTAAECTAIGEFIAGKLNAMTGPVRFVLPEGGVSALDAPGKAFWDPAADKALFAAIESNLRSGTDRKLIRSPLHINDPAFADLLARLFREIVQPAAARRAS